MIRLILRNLAHYWRTNLAVVAGVATSVAVLSGALLVGESVRASLRALIVQRLGATDVVVSSDLFFRDTLAEEMRSQEGTSGLAACPLIRLQGVVTRQDSGRRSRAVQIYGVDARFWRFHGVDRSDSNDDRLALAGSALAETLGIRTGEDLLLRLEAGGAIPRESLYGRRDTVGRTIRLKCGGVLAANQMGEFALQPAQEEALVLFVPLARLQRDLAQASRVNTVLVGSVPVPADAERVRGALNRAFTLQDAGLKIRPLRSNRAFAIESARILFDDSLARAAFGTAADLGVPASGVYSYLANSIRVKGREIPYSVITAADLGGGALTDIRYAATGNAPGTSPDDSIWLNDWAARELDAKPGDQVEVDYNRWDDTGHLSGETARFRFTGVVATAGDISTELSPEFPGVSEAKSIHAWDPPFPMNLRRIRPADEDYWRRYRATPKAFVTLAKGQQLWRSRFGQLSSVRIALPAGEGETSKLAKSLRDHIDAGAAGFSVTPVRARGLVASEGATDFGEYFVYFSFFLIVAALLLAALFFRLGVEQRVREIGTLQAVGYSATKIRLLFLAEGAALSIAGSLVGLVGAIAYGGVLIFGLRTWWIGATGTRQVFLHLSVRDLATGAVAGVAASLGAVLWALRGLRHASTRSMLAGILESGVVRGRRARMLAMTGVGSLLAALALLAAAVTKKVPEVEGFFGVGVLLLVSMLSLLAVYLRRTHVRPITGPGWPALVRLGARHVTDRPGRSLLCIALIAFATFVIVSVEAFRKDPGDADLGPGSGTGGFPLIAQSVLPIVTDPNSDAGREALGIDPAEDPQLARVRFVPFREREGEDTSCLNLYAPQDPRILGATPSFVREARFAFQSSLATTGEQRRNPWTLLEVAQPDGVIPAIGDANTIQYILHRALGDELTVRGDHGGPVRLRLVAELRDSILQGELIIAESNFLKVFSNREGYRFFLMDVPAANAAALVPSLEERLADFGVSIENSADRLAAYHRVENTYLSTFQSLGALGLVFGTIGLAAVLLRNVLERRGELALLRAVGYRGSELALVIVSENMLLMIGGLLCGSVCAMLAVVPALQAHGGTPPFGAAGAMLLVVLVAGLLSSIAAVLVAWRSPLLASIRSE